MVIVRYLMAGLLLFLLAGSGSMALGQAVEREEILLKAAFVYNFAKFTRWPSDTWSDGNAPLTLCTAGDDDLVDALAGLVGKAIKGRKVTIVPHTEVSDFSRCQLLYVASSERHYADLLNSVSDSAVLTISELPGFWRSGGVIELYRENDKVRFVINRQAARRAGLKLDARLLNLAIVRDGDAA